LPVGAALGAHAREGVLWFETDAVVRDERAI